MHVPDAPVRRSRRHGPSPSTNLRGLRLAARCAAGRGSLVGLLAEELLVVRMTFRVTPARESAPRAAARLLAAVLPRAVPPGAVAALADDLTDAHEGGGSWTLTDVDVRLWFLSWSLARDHQGASRST
jgi:hypothetical protein